ncbi:Grx4 family monothiol glutaredoxin [Wenzhouxiangella marina]|uniref:Probable monothiol glutaredoxin 2 n=1 Tax=Wenzhouxiangella marina TaxID=1579979 RepID=A0A0K0XUK5_9GAMM|nr:glutaredoxin [Wenzhouxiangella marina]MBB6086905.1 monothiol glutaredoxin [Wenzhouxiangella marina]
MSLDPAVRERIENQIASHEVFLYMKGSPKMPQCGFSARTVGILDSLLAGNYGSFNVLEDESIREGIKVFGDWPTIPQLYVKGELVGGCDIITEMYNAGELHELFGLDAPDRTPPEIEITDKAAEKIREFLASYPGQHLHFSVGSDWQAQFQVGPKAGHEIASESNGLTVLMDLATAERARGARIDWTESMQGEGLSLDLPGAPAPVKDMSPAELQDRMNAGERLMIIDTRSESDRRAWPLDFARGLDAELMTELKDADRMLPLVFICAQGISSRPVAEHYRKQGFSQVYNLTGGAAAILGQA